MSRGFRSDSDRAVDWLCAALIALPFLQVLPLDFDRSGTLILLGPVLWLGGGRLVTTQGRAYVGPLVLAAFGACLVSVALAEQPAPALVTAASWMLLGGAALLASQAIASDPKAGQKLLAAIALGSASATVVVWFLWLTSGRGPMPLYAHHRHLGLHALSGAIASTVLILAPPNWLRPRWSQYAVGIIVWAGMLWSGGRAPVLAVGVGLVAWWLVRPSDRRRLATAAGIQLLGGLALSAALWTPRPELGWWHAINRTSAAMVQQSAVELSSSRTAFWQETLHRVKLRPWIGHGPDSYRFLTPKLDGQQPHNVVLQLWLDLGFIGSLPLLALLGVGLYSGFKYVVRPPGTIDGGVWPALLLTSVTGGMLDGVFYHLVAVLPAMVALGGCYTGVVTAPRRTFLPIGCVLAALILALHSWIFYNLTLATPPSPASASAQLLRRFPSSTFGLWRWLDDWQVHDPGAVLEWTRWAEKHSPNPPFFHVYAARVFLAEGNPSAAEAELTAARSKAHASVRPQIDAMLDSIRTAALDHHAP